MWDNSARSNKTFERAWIYALHAGDNNYRYIGLSTVHPETRIANYMVPSSRVHGNPNIPTAEWIHENRKDIEYVILDELQNASLEDRKTALELHIEEAQANGHELLNGDSSERTKSRNRKEIRRLRSEVRAESARLREERKSAAETNGHGFGLKPIPSKSMETAPRKSLPEVIVPDVIRPLTVKSEKPIVSGVPAGQRIVVQLGDGVTTQREIDLESELETRDAAMAGAVLALEDAAKSVADAMDVIKRIAGTRGEDPYLRSENGS
jgi:hypothetical protein